MQTNQDIIILDKISNLEKDNISLSKELEHIQEKLKNDSVIIKAMKEEQENQELSISSLEQSRKSQQKLHAFLLSLTGGLLGYIIKSLLLPN